MPFASKSNSNQFTEVTKAGAERINTGQSFYLNNQVFDHKILEKRQRHYESTRIKASNDSFGGLIICYVCRDCL